MACDRKIGPFDCCSVVQGDCLELMKQLPDGCVDAVVTDPPYGIDAARHRHSEKWGWTDFPITGWDKFRPSSEHFAQMMRVSEKQVFWGGNYFSDMLPASSKWLIWDKGQTDFSLADVEMAWCSWNGASRRITVSRAIALQDGKVHPTQKSLAVMIWCLAQVPGDTILDPYAGSGTTLMAARRIGNHFLGFEVEPEYCEIARKRIAAVEAQPTLFEPKPIQEELGL